MSWLTLICGKNYTLSSCWIHALSTNILILMNSYLCIQLQLTHFVFRETGTKRRLLMVDKKPSWANRGCRHYCRDWWGKYIKENQMIIFITYMSLKMFLLQSLMAKRKYNVGHGVRQRWVFGGVCQHGRGFLQLVPDRSAATLLPIIRDHIAPGTIIHSWVLSLIL